MDATGTIAEFIEKACGDPRVGTVAKIGKVSSRVWFGKLPAGQDI